MVLILNKRNKIIKLKVPAEFNNAKRSTIDELSADNAAVESVINGDTIELKPFAVSLVTLK